MNIRGGLTMVAAGAVFAGVAFFLAWLLSKIDRYIPAHITLIGLYVVLLFIGGAFILK